MHLIAKHSLRPRLNFPSQEAGMIKYARGKIEILDVEGLRETSCECYETIKGQYQQFLPIP
jgi:hypothetical protein